MTKIGIIGWRGMVGSVLLERMRAEKDFELVEPTFFSTSQAGGRRPTSAARCGRVEDANDIEALARLPMLVSTQGGDYTTAVHSRLREAGWQGYWIDAASTLRMADDAVIVLDPVNLPVMQAARAAGIKDFIGGNCTVSLMLMAVCGLLRAGIVEWITAMTYQSASGAGAQNMREMLEQMGVLASVRARSRCAIPPRPSSTSTARSSGALADAEFPTDALRRAAGRESDSLDRQGSGQRSKPRGMEGRRRIEQDHGHCKPAPCRWKACACASARCAATRRH